MVEEWRVRAWIDHNWVTWVTLGCHRIISLNNLTGHIPEIRPLSTDNFTKLRCCMYHWLLWTLCTENLYFQTHYYGNRKSKTIFFRGTSCHKNMLRVNLHFEVSLDKLHKKLPWWGVSPLNKISKHSCFPLRYFNKSITIFINSIHLYLSWRNLKALSFFLFLNILISKFEIQ